MFDPMIRLLCCVPCTFLAVIKSNVRFICRGGFFLSKNAIFMLMLSLVNLNLELKAVLSRKPTRGLEVRSIGRYFFLLILENFVWQKRRNKIKL